MDTRRPLPFVCIDIWQGSPEGQYDYHEVDPNIKFEYKNELNTHGRSSHFDYRARLITDEQGRYEYETVKPSHYFYTPSSTWRCPHIHYYVHTPGYKPVITELYFKGEEKNDIGMNSLYRSKVNIGGMLHSFLLDHHIRESTTIELIPVECKRHDGSNLTYFKGEFDIVMATDESEKKEN